VIPRDFITESRAEAPWVQDFQVEQDLVISRALIAIFSHPLLREALAFRGGTALYKLHLKPAARYSEDIDLVQTRPEPAGRMMEALRGVLDPWLGAPVWKQTAGRVTFVYRFSSEETPPLPLRLKVEINSREHFAVYGLTQVPFAVSSRWFEGQCEICSYELDELLGTKLRAFYQRKQGPGPVRPRDRPGEAGGRARPYRRGVFGILKRGGHKVTRAQFEKNMAEKLLDPAFTADIGPLLAAGFAWDIGTAAPVVSSRLIELLPGAPWKGGG